MIIRIWREETSTGIVYWITGPAKAYSMQTRYVFICLYTTGLDINRDRAAEIITGTVNGTLKTTEVTVFDSSGTEKMIFTESKTLYGVKLAVGSLFLE